MVMICWSIWKARNDIVWNQRWRSVDEVVAFAMLSLNQYIAAQNTGSIPSLSPLLEGDGAERWAKPVANTIKVNVDASILEKEKGYGYAFVVRDEEGVIVDVSARFLSSVVSPSLADAIGIKEALSWVKEHQGRRVGIESDSLVSIQAIRSSNSMYPGFGLVIQECMCLVESLSNIALHFVKRFANRAAHVLVRHAGCLDDRSIRFREGDAPTEFSDVIMSEMS